MAGSIRGTARQPVDLTGPLVDTSFLPSRHEALPLVFTPRSREVDLAGWAEEHRASLHRQLLDYGALLFRGFDITTAREFERTAAAIAPEALFGDYGDLPRHEESGKLFFSTPYPEDLEIHFHNESSHMASWPLSIFFYCAIPAGTGGETPLLDCRLLCDVLPADLLEEFAAKGLVYTRNFSEGIDVPWPTFFGTTDRAEVEAICAKRATVCEWRGERLRIRQRAAAVRAHPETGDRVFFNQVLLHHPAALPTATRSALIDLCGTDDELPRYVAFGDGTTIADEVVVTLQETFAAHAARFPWERYDILCLDNMLVSHGRAAFSGSRRVLVAMSQIVAA